MPMTPRRPGELLVASAQLYRRHWRLVLAMTLPIVVIVVGLTALGLGELGAHYPRSLSERDLYIEGAANELVAVPLVTSILARVVWLESRGEHVPVTALLGDALEAFPAALLAVLVWLLISAAGFVLLIVPGIYTFVNWYFVVQAVSIDGARGFEPLTRSAALVRGNWWRSFGVGACFVVINVLVTEVITALFGARASAANTGAVLVAGEIVAYALMLPFLAIGATLYYLDLRELAARRAAPQRRY
jgi:hypothetical protein